MDIASVRWLDDMRMRHQTDYRIERELADGLRSMPAAERGPAYGKVYEELLQRLPDHPALSVDRAQRDRAAADRLRFARKFSHRRSSLLEVGSREGAFVLAAARRFKRVVGTDFSNEILGVNGAAENVETFVLDGPTLPFADRSIDIAYSDQFLQKLHPDDAAAHLREVRRVLSPLGAYICVTPNGASGPHDISVFFDELPHGVHLREYRSRELAKVLHTAGFRRVRFYLGGRGHYVRVPAALQSGLEWLFTRLPRATRSRLSESAIVGNTYPLLGLNAVADGLPR